ncbi:MAG: PEP-CTERM sorting domain-containing protein [Verrucomicrobiota bacterium]
MTRFLSISFLLLLTIQPLAAQTIVIEDFDNSGFDFYTAGASDWNTSAVIGPSYLTIGPNAMGNGNATISRFFRTIPDLTGITEIQIDLRLGSGNQVNQMGFYIADAFDPVTNPDPTSFQWAFTVLDEGLNTGDFTTVSFDLSNPDIVLGDGTLQLDNIQELILIGGAVAEETLDFRMDVDNLVGVVPEPTSLGLLSAGLATLVWRRRKGTQ